MKNRSAAAPCRGIVERRVPRTPVGHVGGTRSNVVTRAVYPRAVYTCHTVPGEKTRWTAAALFHRVIKTDAQTRSGHERIVRVPIGYRYYYYYYLLLLLSFDLRAYK